MLVLITGGSASGKSEYAESVATELKSSNLIYIATMKPYDDECYAKINRHKIMRKNKGFSTLECYTNLSELTISNNSSVLLECMSNLLANEMYSDGGAKETSIENISKGIEKLNNACDNVIIVSNEIFSDGKSYDIETKEYIKNLGEINCRIAQMADLVVEVVCAIPIIHKGLEEGK